MMRRLLVSALFVLAACTSNLTEAYSRQSLFKRILRLERTVATLSTKLRDKDAQLANIARSLAAQATDVAYSVSLRSNTQQIGRKALTFDTVLYNQGNAYKKATGIFTAPVSGTYVFWANVMVRSRVYMTLNIFKGSTLIGRGYITGQVHGVASITTTTYLRQGDHVWMYVDGSSSTIPLRGSQFSSYGGTLIRARAH